MSHRPFALLLLLTAALLCATVTAAATVTEDIAERVASNWVRAVEHARGSWGKDGAPKILYEQTFARGDQVLGHLFRVAPHGYVLVPVRRELSPITAYSESTRLPGRFPETYFDFLRDALADRIDALEAGLGGGEHPAWARLGLPADEFEASLTDKDEDWEGEGPMITSRWHQGWPFNELCPLGSDGRTYVGCTGLALAQILRYHTWPMRGVGSVSYWWDGDADCGSGSPGETISVNLMVPHDWQRMPDELNWLTPAEERYAVSELCFHVAAALQTDFSTCGSSASLSRANAVLVNNFNYEYGAREQPRFRFPDSVWFGMIRSEIDAGYPVLYASTIHTMVCDGWREGDGLQHVHINYGWGGESDGWFALDSIETSLNPYAERMVTGIRPGNTVQTLVPELAVERVGSAARLTWGLESLDPATEFHVWRGPSCAETERLTSLPLAGATEYEWYDEQAPEAGAYYRLEMILPGVPSIWIGPEWLAPLVPRDDDPVVPSLNPNPFNPRTTVRFDLPRDAAVQAEIYDLAGRRVRTLVDGPLPAGPHRAVWDGRDASGRAAASGRYLLRLAVDGSVTIAKLTLAK